MTVDHIIDTSTSTVRAEGSTSEIIGGGAAKQFVAASESVSALRAVHSNGGVAHANAPEELDSVIGVAATAGTIGTQIEVKTHGPMEDGSWSWNEGDDIFVQDDGSLGTSPGTHMKKVAVAWSATRIYVDIEQTWRIE